MKKFKLFGVAVTAVVFTGCASLGSQLTDATALSLQESPENITIVERRVSGFNMAGDARMEWRALSEGVYYDCTGYDIGRSSCVESPDQEPHEVEAEEE